MPSKYCLDFTENVAQSLRQYLKSQAPDQIGVLCDENTEKHCLPKIFDALPKGHHLFKIPSGEAHKHLGTCERLWAAMTEAKFDRSSLLINLGGGVIGDMGGFVARVYKRGMSFVNLPTTLLAQVDASIGGKLGIDFRGFKNHLGMFGEPEKIIIDTDFLGTLPKRECYSGFAEVLKHGLIHSIRYWNEAKHTRLLHSDWKNIVTRSIEIKQRIVAEDPFESGIRKVLNFGHTLGHAIESYFLAKPEERLLHGEAIAIGMICETYLSHKFSTLTKDEMEEVVETLVGIYQPRAIDTAAFEPIVQNTLQDKKNRKGTVQFSLLQSIGKCTYDIPIAAADMLNSLFYFNTQATRVESGG